MSDPVARSWQVTRRSLAGLGLGLLGLGAAETWPRWAFWRGGDGLDSLASLPEAEALRALGKAVVVPPSMPPDAVAAALRERLADGGYAAAVALDLAEGRLMAAEGWLVPETQALAGLWLASAGS